MRLVVKQNDRTVNEFQFEKGPVYIGRGETCQVRLHDRTVSRQHAVLFNTQDGKWTVEDLGSANKTYLNDQVIQKTEIKTGDRLRIIDFTIEITLDETAENKKPAHTETEKPTHSEDTIAAPTVGSSQIIERKLGTADAPPIRIPAHRVTDLLQANEKINQAHNPDELLLALLDVTSKQLGTYHSWCAMRNSPTGPMTCHAGKTREGQPLELNNIKLNEKINDAIEKSNFLLFIFSKDMTKEEKGQIRSVVIAPIIGPVGCFGILYANNTFRDEHYSLSDLDYLMLLGMHVSSALQKMTDAQ
jgi:pSer/pThr/pTyr-binding forkhead associated (FHA) protein